MVRWPSDRRFVQATQVNMSGTGIATFTDRIRDAVRGGGPFDSGAGHVVNQGFISGGGYDPNAENSVDDPNFIDEALCSADQIRATMAGSISDYEFEVAPGATVTGAEIGYGDCDSDTPTSYVSDPEEIINYSAAHDNETLWDISQYKHSTAVSTGDRVRAQNIGLDIILLGQGVSFVHAGQDLLRSKSTDRDSFNWGDWFNKLDFSGQDNNWAVGSPQRGEECQQLSGSDPAVRESADGSGAGEYRLRQDSMRWRCSKSVAPRSCIACGVRIRSRSGWSTSTPVRIRCSV